MARAASDDGHLSEPAGIPRLGVLVFPSWFGLRDVVRDLCRDLAEHGYLALAPSYPYGDESPAPGDDDAARVALASVEPEHLASLVQASASLAHRLLLPGVPLVVLGFGAGASLALWIGARRPDLVSGVVGFYGSQGRELDDIRGPIQLHLGERDEVVDQEELVLMQADLQLLGKQVEAFTYPAVGHGFVEPDLPGFAASASALALERMWAFLDGLAVADPGSKADQ